MHPSDVTTIYVAGKLNDDACGYLRNVHRMLKTEGELQDRGFATYAPGSDLLSLLVSGKAEYERAFNNSQAFLLRCDAVFLVDGWETSEGTKREIALAQQYEIPVFEDINDLITWTNERQSDQEFIQQLIGE